MTPNLATSMPVATLDGQSKVIGKGFKRALLLLAPLAMACFLIVRGVSLAAQAEPDSLAGMASTLVRGFYCTCALSGVYLAARAVRKMMSRQ